MVEIEKDGNKLVNYKNFHSALGGVIQRGAIDPDTVQQEPGLRQSLIQM